jgi:CheY-like chemotaxis protein
LRILVLDDDDTRHEWFKEYFKDFEAQHVYTVDGAITALIADPQYDFVFLDHDLNDNQYKSVTHIDGDNIPGFVGQCRKELTGLDVTLFIARILEPEKRPKEVVVHSWNPPGAERMIQMLREVGIKTHKWEFRSNESPFK